MKNNFFKKYILLAFMLPMLGFSLMASSHREAPLIADDPTADNVDLYAFRSPDDPNTITLIATYIPMQLPFGGPNYYNFDPSVRYEIHVDNDATTPGDDVTYRFTFTQVNEDPTTFFNIRLGKQNLKTTYKLEKITAAGTTVIVENGVVPPNNIGPRSIEGGAGLNTTYDALFNGAVTTATTGAKVYAGPTDDPFFVDLGGIFDLGNSPRQEGGSRDDLACLNVHALAIQVPIANLLKAGAAATPANILDADYVIGVWASASRPKMTVFSATGNPVHSGDYVQVSRLGMPLTNEAVIPVGQKDFWNAISPYDEISETTLDEYFYNPELALYMSEETGHFGAAVPSFAPLRIQTASLGSFNFTNGADGLFGLKGNPALAGTALDDAVFGTLLLPAAAKPRSVDLWPIFHTGVPNARPYQLATGKGGDVLAAGKPFINNFLPNGGDMLRLNMAVPVTPRDDANFSSLGLVQAAAIGLTVAPFNTTADLEFIPNMDGFPNGRRLEDDVTRIELQAVGGVVLAAIGLWYDDYDPATSASPVTPNLVNVLGYSTGVEANDEPFTGGFPFLAQPHSGTGECSGTIINDTPAPMNTDFAATDAQIFASSNTSGQATVYGITSNGAISTAAFPVMGMDADGIHYDAANDVVYQASRTDNVVNSYTNVLMALSAGNNPMVGATSSSDFSNARELTASGDRLVVAQDANDVNGGNKFVVYQTSASGITFQKSLESTINLWGIDAFGETLFAIEDNSNRLAIYENFFAMTGTAMPTNTVAVEGIVRTHGLTYWPNTDMMILTDVADGGSDANDGAIVVVKGFTAAAADGTISASEQLRIAGDATFLANPVDVAIDINKMMIYVAERKNSGGRILGFAMPTESGEFAPTYNVELPGASAVYLNGNPAEMAPPTGGDCAAPTGVAVDLQTPRKTRVSWSATDSAQMYQFQIRFKGMERWLVTAKVRNTSVAIFAPSGKTYEFRVASVCDGEAGAYGPVMEYTSMSGLVGNIAQSRSGETGNEESIFIEGEDLNVFPNPVNQNLTVQYKTKTTGTLELFHVSGKQVKYMALSAGNSTYNLDMNDLADGFYLLKIVEEGQMPITQQVIKQAVR